MSPRTAAPRKFLALSIPLAVAAATAVMAPVRADAVAPDVKGSEASLGVAIPGNPTTIRSEDSAIGALSNGTTVAVYGNAGSSGMAARLFAMDMAGNTIAEVDLPAGMNVQALTYNASRKSFFISSDDNTTGYVYEWSGGTTVTERVKIAGHMIQSLDAADNGDVYVGTYSANNGRLFRWSNSGGTVDLGQPIAGQSYVREIEVTADSVYTTNYASAPARLTKISIATNAKTNVALPTAISGQKSIEDLQLAGNYMFGLTADSNYLFALNLSTLQTVSFNDQINRSYGTPETSNVVPYLSGVSPYTVSPLFEGKYVYLQRAGAGLMRIDTTNGMKTIRVNKYWPTEMPSIWNGANVSGPTEFAWLPDALGRPGPSVVASTIDGKLVVNTPAQSAPATASLNATGSPSLVWSMGTGPNGEVYAGGFNLPAGIAKYDPATKTKTLLNGPQIEGFGTYGSTVYMGAYNGANTSSAPIYKYTGTGTPAVATYLNNYQERPVALKQVGTTLAIGSMPVKNTFGGALSLYNPSTGALTVKRNLIPNQSIISLGAYNNLVVGGSSNAGGTGTTPSGTTMAQIFTYDLSTGALKTLQAPGPSTSTYRWVAAITPDPVQAGAFWAISTGELIKFQVATDGSITVLKNFGAYGGGTSSPSGRELGIVFDKTSGTMFVTMNGNLQAVNPVTGERMTVATKTAAGDIEHLVSPDGGQNLFYARGAEWFQYTVNTVTIPTDPCAIAPVLTSHQADTYYAPNQNVVFSGTGSPGSTVTLKSGTRTRTATVDNSGKWTLYQLPMGWWSGPMTFTGTKAGCSAMSNTYRMWFVTKPTSNLTPKITSHNTTTTYTGGTSVVFGGTGRPGALVTMTVGSQTRFATVRTSGYWTMRSVAIGHSPVTIGLKSELPQFSTLSSSTVIKFS